MKWEKRKEKELDRKRKTLEGYEVGDNERNRSLQGNKIKEREEEDQEDEKGKRNTRR